MRQITHIYPGTDFPALCNVDLCLNHGEACTLIGPSGSGKSTLLNLLGLLDTPSGGLMYFAGENMAGATPDRQAWLRSRKIGFVFQAFSLLPKFNLLDNVALPLFYQGTPLETRRGLALACLQQVGLGERAQDFPANLSGGQRQRVAIARALVTQPTLILADEPTGSLDGDTAREVLDLLLDLNERLKVTLLVVTHDMAISARFPRCLRLRQGRLDLSDNP